jgi:hypothetical protein
MVLEVIGIAHNGTLFWAVRLLVGGKRYET